MEVGEGSWDKFPQELSRDRRISPRKKAARGPLTCGSGNTLDCVIMASPAAHPGGGGNVSVNAPPPPPARQILHTYTDHTWYSPCYVHVI